MQKAGACFDARSGEVTTNCPRFRLPSGSRKARRLAAYIALDNAAHDAFYMESSFIGDNWVVGGVFRL